MSLFRVVIFLAYVSSSLACSRSKYTNKVLLISFDGFRYDYFKKVHTPNFDEIIRTGVKAPYVTSTFNTKSFPTHYSIATGLYQENHGIMGNHFYDPELGHFNRKNKSQVQDPRWWLGEPIWKTVRKADKLAATYFWPGSEIALKDPTVNKAFVMQYNGSTSFQDRVDRIMDWFTKDNVDFATLYYHEPDLTGHRQGPDSDAMVETLKTVDGFVGYLIKKLKSKELWDSVNLIIVSDHGMTNMKQENVINLVDLANFRESDVNFTADWGTMCQIQPAENSLDNVYNTLRGAHPNLTVYLKEDFPEHWHFKNTKRVSPIIIVADEGYNVRLATVRVYLGNDGWPGQFSSYKVVGYYEQVITSGICKVTDSGSMKDDARYILDDIGTHGYDNRLMTMKSIFLARGPNFLTNYTTTAFSITDIYPLICEIMNITPAEHDGKLENVESMLKPTEMSSVCRTSATHILVMVCGVLAMCSNVRKLEI